jgi:phosphatidylserine/phosphatidylglycerophosphate/cardiolipin synthase-like enzyme
LYVYDHPIVLDEALSGARRRLLLVSPWVRNAVVTDAFLNKLTSLLQRGADVYIGYGLGQPEDGNDPRAVRQLRRVSERHKNFHFVHIGDTHAKILVQDDTLVVVTSFNWLSFRGDPAKTFRDEQGVLIRNKDLADEKFHALIGWFEAAKPAHIK